MIGKKTLGKKKLHKLNEELLIFPELRLVSHETESGIKTSASILEIAKREGNDLILVTEQANPPVCTIEEYSKYLYKLEKKNKEASKANKQLDMKELQMGPNTADADYEVRRKKSQEFLEKGHVVRIIIKFRGREIIHRDRGQALILKMVTELEPYGKVDKMPELNGKKMSIDIKPKKK